MSVPVAQVRRPRRRNKPSSRSRTTVYDRSRCLERFPAAVENLRVSLASENCGDCVVGRLIDVSSQGRLPTSAESDMLARELLVVGISGGGFSSSSSRDSLLNVVLLLEPRASFVEFFARGAASSVEQSTPGQLSRCDSSCDTESLFLALRGLSAVIEFRSLAEKDSRSSVKPGAEKDTNLNVENSELSQALQASMPLITKSIHRALFQMERGWRPSSQSVQSEGLVSAGLSSSAWSGTDTDSRVRRSDLRSRRGAVGSPHDRLRHCALECLGLVATVSSLALIPYWGLFLPEHGAVSSADSEHQPKRGSLAYFVLYETDDAFRGACVSVVTQLVSKSWRFVQAPHSTSSPQSLGAGERKSSVSGFTSVGARVTNVCSALYTVTASGIHRERSPGVLARLVRLATELFANVRLPAVQARVFSALLEALRRRVSHADEIDLTSRAAGLSCMTVALSNNLLNLRSMKILDCKELTVLCLDLLDINSTLAPEILNLLAATSRCSVGKLSGLRARIIDALENMYRESSDEKVVRLHVARCTLALVDFQHEQTGEGCKVESRALDVCPVHDEVVVLTRLASVAVSDSFHAVRVCSARAFEVAFLGFRTMWPSEFISGAVGVLSGLMREDEPTSVRSAAVKAMGTVPLTGATSVTQVACYEAVVTGLLTCQDRTLRSKFILAAGTLIEQHMTWENPDLFETSSPVRGLFLDQCSASIEALSGSDGAGAWAAGCCVEAALKHSSIGEIMVFGIDVPAFLHTLASFSCDQSAHPKLRWHCCYAVGRIGIALGVLGSRDVQALVNAVLDGTWNKVTAASSRALASLADGRCIPSQEVDSVLGAALRVFAVAPDAVIQDVGALVCAVLRVRSSREGCTVSYITMLQAIMREGALPQFSLLALSPSLMGTCSTGGLVPGRAEEVTAARDSWISLPPQLRSSIFSAGRIAESGNSEGDENVARLRIIAAASLISDACRPT